MILMLVTRGRDMMYKHNEKKILMNLFFIISEQFVCILKRSRLEISKFCV